MENLRFICPNCHTQTVNFSGRKNKKPKIKFYESKENREIRLVKLRKFNPSKEKLEELVGVLPMTKIGKMFGVSDNAVRKRCKLLGISW